MAYLILNKETNEPSLVGSLPKVVEKTKLHKKSLEYHFSQKKQIEFNTDLFRIVKFPDINIIKRPIKNKDLENNYKYFLKKFVD